jgi:hypothetical protein
MATGVVSTAFHIIDASTISQRLLEVAVVGLVHLMIAYIWPLMAFRGEVARDACEPSLAFGFFTVVAGIDVVGTRLYTPSSSRITIAPALIAIPIWFFLTYAVRGILILRPRDTPVSTELIGSWFLWVAVPQSLAVAASVIGDDRESEFLSAVAVACGGLE